MFKNILYLRSPSKRTKWCHALVAELVDAQDLKSCESQISCRFKSGLRHHAEKYPSLVEGTGLENREAEQSTRGFESLLLRHLIFFIYRGMEQSGSSSGS